MNCAACRHENPVGSAFCEECGARLERRCPSCRSVCAPTAKFCRTCGSPLAADPERPTSDAGARKVVTIVFADLVGSTALHERLDAESTRRLMDGYYAALHAAIAAHGGTVVKLLGDGVMAAFGPGEGNPLFVGELARMLVHDGTLKRVGDRWTTTVELATLDMPPTIHALLAARIERLRPEERTVVDQPALRRVDVDYPGLGRFPAWTMGHPEAITFPARFRGLRRSRVVMTMKRSNIIAMRVLAALIGAGLLSTARAAAWVERLEGVGKPAKTPDDYLREMTEDRVPRLPPLFAIAKGRDAPNTLNPAARAAVASSPSWVAK
jgi:hypothetical protein